MHNFLGQFGNSRIVALLALSFIKSYLRSKTCVRQGDDKMYLTRE